MFISFSTQYFKVPLCVVGKPSRYMSSYLVNSAWSSLCG